MGINATDRGECLYEEATRALSRLLEGGAITFEERGIDQFDRVLAYVWVDDALVNLSLVADGLAIATTPEDGDDLGASLVTAEEKAYGEGVGIWDECDDPVSAGLALELETGGHDPPGPDDDALSDEVVAITNSGSETADLTGWMMRDESSAHRYSVHSGTVLAPGGSLDVSSSDPGWDPGKSPVWNNDGDMVLLLDAGGGVVSRARYQD